MTRLAAVFARPPVDTRSDGALLAAFLLDRDEPAFAELVRRHGPLVWATCRRALPDPADAEDAFQATFLVLVRRADRLTTADSLGPWLYRVAAWTGRALRRKNARRRAIVGSLSAAVADPHPAGIAVELDDLLLALPDRYRSAVVLCHLQGLTHREAADRLGCAEGTVASLVSRALAKLRAKLGREPAAILALATAAAVPSDLSAGAVRSAVVFHQSAAASPAVAHLTEGVLRMFWVKKAAGVAAAMVLVAGIGLGVSVRSVPQAGAADDPPGRPAPASPRADDSAVIRAEMDLIRREAERTDLELKRLMKQADDLSAHAKAIQTDRDALAKRYADLEARRADLAKGPAQGGKVNAGAGGQLTILLSGQLGAAIEVMEARADGRTAWEATFPQTKGNEVADLRAYLSRAARDKDGPKKVVVAAAKEVPYATVRTIVQLCADAGFERTRVSAEVRDTVSRRIPLNFREVQPPSPPPTRKRSLGGDGPPGGEFHEDLAVGETIRIAVHGGRQNDPIPTPPNFLRLTADAEGLIVTGLKPGVARVTVRDTKGRDHTIRIEVADVPKSGR